MVRSPAPAVVLSISVEVGETVVRGDRLAVLESMKTELTVTAPCAGRVREVLASGGKLPEQEALHCQLRFLADGLVIGSREFVNQAFRLSREHFSPRRRDGARRLRGIESELCAMRDLQVRAVA